MARYLTGRVKRVDQSQIPTLGLEDRFRYVSLNDVEPNLGDPPGLPENNIPIGERYQVVSIIGFPGRRFWVRSEGQTTPGSITIFDEGNLVGGINSTTQLDFRGFAVNAIGVNTGTPEAGIAVTVRINPSQFSNDSEIIFNRNGEFAAISNFVVEDVTNFIGVGVGNPTQQLDVGGSVRIRNGLFDSSNDSGSQGYLLTAGDGSGEIAWADPRSVDVAAAGTVTNVQFHDSNGGLGGAPNFVYDNITNPEGRVGIGSTQPRLFLDVGENSDGLAATFRGLTTVEDLLVEDEANILVAEIGELTVNGVGPGPDVTFNTEFNATVGGQSGDINLGRTGRTNIIDTNSSELTLDSSTDQVRVEATTLDIIDLEFEKIRGEDGIFTGILTASTLDAIDEQLQNLLVTGITTLGYDSDSSDSGFGRAEIRQLQIGDGGLQVIDNQFGPDLPGIATITTANIENLNTRFINIPEGNVGVASIQNIVIGDSPTPGNESNTITTRSGNLIIDSASSVTQFLDQINLDNDTQSDDPDSGALVVSGGAGIALNVNLGAELNVFGSVVPSPNPQPPSEFSVDLNTGGGNTRVGGDLRVSGNLFVDGDIRADEADRLLVNLEAPTDQRYLTFIPNGDYSAGIYTNFGTNPTLFYDGATTELNSSGFKGSTLDIDQTVDLSGTITLGENDSSSLTINALLASSISLNANEVYDLGSNDVRFDTIFARIFNGTFEGTATNAENLEIGEQVNSGTFYLSFVADNNPAANRDFEPFFTSANITFDPGSGLDVSGNVNVSNNLTVTNNSVLSGNVDLGSNGNDSVSINGVVDTDILPSPTNNRDLGSATNRWESIFVNNIVGDPDTTVERANLVRVTLTPDNNEFSIPFIETQTVDLEYTNIRQDDQNNLLYNPTNNELIIEGAGDLIVGRNNGSVALTINDGGGNANVTFNHVNQVPDTTGKAFRIVTNVDNNTPTVAGNMDFHCLPNVIGGNNSPVSAASRILRLSRVSSPSEVRQVLPGQDITTDIGAPSLRFQNIYAETFNGTFQGNAESASTLATQQFTADNNYFFTFVDSNNTPAAQNENYFTIPAVTFNTTNSILSLTGSLNASQNLTAGNDLTVTNTSNLNGNVILGSSSANNISFNGSLNTDIIPQANNSFDLGSAGIRFATVFATTFNGRFEGTADSANTLRTEEFNDAGNYFFTFVDSNNTSPEFENYFTIPAVSFSTTNSTLILTGSLSVSQSLTVGGDTNLNGNTTIGNEDTDTVVFNARLANNLLPNANGTRNLGAAGLRFGTVFADTFNGSFEGTADSANTLRTEEFNNEGIFFPTFVNSNNTVAEFEDYFTSSNLSFNTGTNTLNLTNLTVSETSNLEGNVLLGSDSADLISFNGSLDTSIVPQATNTVNLGADSLRFDTVFARVFEGQFEGTADSALEIETGNSNANEDFNLTFVFGNNNPRAFEQVFTDGELIYNPSTNLLQVRNILLPNNGNLEVRGNTILGNNGNEDTVTFGARLANNLLPNVNGARNLGSGGLRFNTVFAETFNGSFEGTADSANTLLTASNTTGGSPFFLTFVNSDNGTADFESFFTNSNITFTPTTGLLSTSSLTVSGDSTLNGDVELGNAAADLISFNGSLDTSIIPQTTDEVDLGSAALRFRNIFAENIEGDFSGTADSARQVFTQSSNATAFRNITFVAGNNAQPTSETVFTDDALQYNPNANRLRTTNLTITGTANLNGNTIIGDNANNDTVTFTARLANNTNLLPAVDEGSDLGASNLKFDNVYANNFIGEIEGIASEAEQIQTRSDASTGTKYITFVNDNNTNPTAENLLTSNRLQFNANNGRLTLDGIITVTGNANFNGIVRLGNLADDDIVFNGRLSTNLLPNSDASRDLGSPTLRFENVYAENFVGEISGIADEARQVLTQQSANVGNEFFLTFVNSNNGTATAESVFTDGAITYNPEDNRLTVGNITLPNNGTLFVSGNTQLGNNGTVDEIRFGARLVNNFLPKVSGASNLGSNGLRFGTVFANTFNGTFSGTADLANDLAINATNRVLYQVSENNTGFLPSGNVNQVLTSQGTTGAPTWTNVSSLPGAGYNFLNPAGGGAGNAILRLTDGTTNSDVLLVGGAGITITRANNNRQITFTADAGGNADNINGGSAGQILVQVAADDTDFVGPGNEGQILVSNGTGGPTFQDPGDAGVGFPAGTRMLFQQATAPTGWQRFTAPSGTGNRALRIVNNAGAGNPNGFSFTQVFGSPSTANFVPGNTTNTGGTSLTLSQIPNHDHNFLDQGHSHRSTYQFGTRRDEIPSGIRPGAEDEIGTNDVNFNYQTLETNTVGANIRFQAQGGLPVPGNPTQSHSHPMPTAGRANLNLQVRYWDAIIGIKL